MRPALQDHVFLPAVNLDESSWWVTLATSSTNWSEWMECWPLTYTTAESWTAGGWVSRARHLFGMSLQSGLWAPSQLVPPGLNKDHIIRTAGLGKRGQCLHHIWGQQCLFPTRHRTPLVSHLKTDKTSFKLFLYGLLIRMFLPLIFLKKKLWPS